MNANVPPVMTTNIPTIAISDEVMVNRNGSTHLQKTTDLATQLAGEGVIAGEFGAVRDEMADGFQSVRTDVDTSMTAVRTEIGGEFNAFKTGVEADLDGFETRLEAAAQGYVVAATWAVLATVNGTRNGQPGRVSGPDAGTHVDSASNQSVANEGEYAWSISAAAWLKMGDLLVSKGTAVAAGFVDALGFVGARLSSDGTFQKNDPARSYEMADTLSASEYLSVSDALGFKAMSLEANGLKVANLETGGGLAFNEGYSATPLIAGNLVAFAGMETRLYARNLMNVRSDLSRVRATVYSEASVDGIRPTYSRTGDDELVFSLDRCGPTVYLQTRLDEVDADLRHLATLSTTVAPNAPAAQNSTSVLMIGDSITNRSMAAWMAAFGTAHGYALNFIGTMNGAGINQNASGTGGPLGEAREGWEFGDFTYAVNDRVSIIQPGNEASYLAADKNTRWPQNPFLRVATGSDSASIVRNGYVFDYGYYLTRFGLAAPKVVFIGLGTNDIRDLDKLNLGPAITDGLSIICGQILAAQPDTKIMIWLPPAARSNDRDLLWHEYVEVISRLVTFVRDKAQANIRIIPTWAMASQEIGFRLNVGTVSELGIQSTTVMDPVHLAAFNASACAEILTAAAACVAQGTL